MNIFKKIYCRIFQFIMRCAMKFINITEPKILHGKNAISKIGEVAKINDGKCALVVTDNFIFSSGMLNPAFESLTANKINYVVFHDVKPNPTIDIIESALKMYYENNCDFVISVGGGSPMDAAKGVIARVAMKNKTIPELKGVLKIRHKTQVLIAVPTTAGTGSETTIAAVVSNPATHEKYAINDPHLVPKYAILDPNLLLGLPAKITSTTGMDALTHAVEAFIGQSTTAYTREKARTAVKLIYNNLYASYEHPENITYRDNMLLASFDAGIAFTRSYVGYVHALAHALGGFYSFPHGEANAILLPYVLEAFGDSVYKKLAILSDDLSLTPKDRTNKEKAEAFIKLVKDLNAKMNIGPKIKGVIKEEDIPLMAKRADKEANPLYPVPRLFGTAEFEKIYHLVKED